MCATYVMFWTWELHVMMVLASWDLLSFFFVCFTPPFLIVHESLCTKNSHCRKNRNQESNLDVHENGVNLLVVLGHWGGGAPGPDPLRRPPPPLPAGFWLESARPWATKAP